MGTVELFVRKDEMAQMPQWAENTVVSSLTENENIKLTLLFFEQFAWHGILENAGGMLYDELQTLTPPIVIGSW